MTVLVDADILLDVALDRSPHYAASAALLDHIEHGGAAGFIAWHTISNLYFLLCPRIGSMDARQFIAEMLRFMGVAPASSQAARAALDLSFKDFEDAMHAAAALACGASRIVTRNPRDYAQSPVPAISPAELLARWLPPI